MTFCFFCFLISGGLPFSTFPLALRLPAGYFKKKEEEERKKCKNNNNKKSEITG